MLGPRRFLAVATLVGTALWLSRAVLDLTEPAGVRVALLPSLPELLGLVVLAGIALTLLQALVEHVVAKRRPEAQLTGTSLLPLGFLGLLALPYLPLLPDWLPLTAVLAGPMRWWVWCVALVATAWAVAVALPERAAGVPRTVRALGPGVVTAAIVAAAMWRLAGGAIYPGGDEPHYLVVAQSVVHDGNLRIDDNYARGDYRAFHAGALKPDHIVPPADNGAIYSIHAIGTSLLVAPGFAWRGYVGAAASILLIAALVGLVLWHALHRLTTSASAATFGWLAVVTSAPFVLRGFAIDPAMPAALAMLGALWWRNRPDTRGVAFGRGLALAVLPWLGTKYAPMAAVLGALLLARAPRDIRRLVAMAVPVAVALAGWFTWFAVLRGSPLPTAPDAVPQLAFGNLVAGLTGLFFDQEYGVVAVAPVLAMAAPGWWHLWRSDAAGRRLAVETLAPLLTLALTVGAWQMWWSESAPPGSQVTAALPLVGVPLAALWRALEGQPVRRGVLVTLLGAGVAISATLVVARDGLLIVNSRDGVAELLDYLAPSRLLSVMAPSFIADRTAPVRPLLVALLWCLALAVVWRTARGRPDWGAGKGGLVSAALVGAAALVLGVALPRVTRQTRDAIAPAQYAALDQFDRASRPFAVVYDPARVIQASAVPPLMTFEATPGLRRAPQPVRVLLNMRLALPAGRYRVEFVPTTGRSLSGTIGLQVGRLGPAQQAWTLDEPPGAAWRQDFDVALDSHFVGFRGDGGLESSLARIAVTPLDVVDLHDRVRRPPVTATAMLGALPAYFHDAHADLEAAGFWVRGRTAADVTFAVHPESDPRGIRLQMHGGPAPTTVQVATPVWSTRVALTPGQHTTVEVPALPAQKLLPVTIAPDGGFVPAEHGGPAGDRRLLGCWVEVVP